MHTNGDAQHGAQGDQVGTDVTIADGTVVGTPVVHDIVCGLEGAAFLAIAARSKPGAGPGGIGALHQSIGNLIG